jgi:flagellar biosynthesis/type III secretory pathway protein FliH
MALTKIQRLERRVAELTAALGQALAAQAFQEQRFKDAVELKTQALAARDKADARAAEVEKAREMWCDRYHEQLARAGRAEGYAEALLARAYPDAPLPPWKAPQFDQYGNRIYS